MHPSIKNLILNQLYKRQVFATDMTAKHEIQALIDALRPVISEQKLIRFGPQGDGGYLIPDCIEGIKACFSPGVDEISGFEADCAREGMKVFMADQSVTQPAESHELFQFTQKHLGATNNENFITLDEWVNSSMQNNQDDLMLQMDIESFEYEVLLSASDNLINRFRIMVIEFHRLDQLWNKQFFQIASRVFNKLLQTHYCIHNHPNNYRELIKIHDIEIPPLTELTFLRKDFVKDSTQLNRQFPHPLDFDNTEKPSVELPKCWYT